jgi:hypothetical protein
MQKLWCKDYLLSCLKKSELNIRKCREDKKKTDPDWLRHKRERQKEYTQKNRQRSRDLAKRYYDKLRLKVLTHYGGNPPKCKCGFSNIKALTIDHIAGGGRKHRSQIHTMFYQWLKQNGFPKGFQVLCMNCQFIKERI